MEKAKKLKVQEFELPIKIEKDPSGGFVATSPSWSDCYAQGDTVDEVVNEITAVAASLIELYKEEGLKIPLKARVAKKGVLSVPVIVSSS